ncbi:DUF6153 family protein [Kribbella amoyensis]|uniref:DUF6153 family protein n=1 Tax=Kribbella amoyensis TaxID=996641 RepID=UPI0011A6FCE8|nr:DUF6153 family protein [Kribbella amoyensis]
MTRWRERIRQGPVKALVVVCVLAGVFAMHGLTGSHDAAMALGHEMPAPSMAGRSVADIGAVAPMSHGDPAVPGVNPAVADVPPSAGVGVELTASDGDGHLHGLGEVCLAMLAALSLALVAALVSRSLVAAYPVEMALPVTRLAIDGALPPWRRPSLSKLCVLRT